MFLKFRHSLRWLLRKRVRDRGLLFTRDNIRIDRDIEYSADSVCAYIEVWFDAEKKFGLKLGDEDYVNVYADVSAYTGDIRLTYIIYYADGHIDGGHKFKKLTPEEKTLILEMVNEVSMSETGMSIYGNCKMLENNEFFAEPVAGGDCFESR